MGRWLGLALVVLAGCATTAGGEVPGGDDSGAPDGGGGDGGDPGDGATIPNAAVTLTPNPVIVARGIAATVTVTLDAPAAAGGATVMLAATSGTAATLPASATVPAGETSTTFQVQGVAPGGPFELSATFAGVRATVPLRVVPAVTAITPSASAVNVGDTARYTVVLDGPAPFAFEVPLTSADPELVSVPAVASVAAGQTSAGFDVTGIALGAEVEITAALGGVSAKATARPLGVYLSEVLYDVTMNDTMFEWVELYNAGAAPIALEGVLLQSAGGAAGNGYVTSLVLAGTLAPGQCAVVGGPSNVGVTFFQALDIEPDFGNATNGAADGIRLVTAGGAVLDALIYGAANGNMITDENGVVSAPDVGPAPANQTLERTAPGLLGAWQVQATPSPGNCAPISQ